MSDRGIGLSEMDKVILQEMLHDTRTSYRTIAKKLRVSHSTVYNRIKRMISEGIILGYTLVINHEKIGINGMAYIGIELKNKDPSELIKVLQNDDRVLEIHEVFSPYDIMIKARSEDMSQLKTDLVRNIRDDMVRRIDVMMAYKTHKDDQRIKLIQAKEVGFGN